MLESGPIVVAGSDLGKSICHLALGAGIFLREYRRRGGRRDRVVADFLNVRLSEIYRSQPRETARKTTLGEDHPRQDLYFDQFRAGQCASDDNGPGPAPPSPDPKKS
jgi:hypothetical protein